jgi:hypothetical protein
MPYKISRLQLGPCSLGKPEAAAFAQSFLSGVDGSLCPLPMHGT